MNTSAHQPSRRSFPALALAITLVLGLFGSTIFTTAYAQSTTTSIFGFAPAGQTISVHSTSGTRRHTKANDKGRYSLRSLPPGIYDITLEKDGQAMDTRRGVQLTIGRGGEVNFACDNDQCAASPSN